MKNTFIAFILAVFLLTLLSVPAYADAVGIPQEKFLSRYSKVVAEHNEKADSEGTRSFHEIAAEDIVKPNFSPNEILIFIVNGASLIKEPMGNMILLSNDVSSLNPSEISQDAALALYAFDASFNDIGEASQLYLDLSHSKTGTMTHGEVDYTIINQSGNMLQIEAVYRGYVPILGVTATPSPTPSAPGEASDAVEGNP